MGRLTSSAIDRYRTISIMLAAMVEDPDATDADLVMLVRELKAAWNERERRERSQ